MSLDNLPPTLSVEKAADILGVSRSSAYRAANSGEIPTFRVGRRLLVPTAKLLVLLTPEESTSGLATQSTGPR